MLPTATWVRPPGRAGLHRARRVLQVVTSALFVFAPFLDLLRFDLKNGNLILFGIPLSLSELGIAYGIILASFILVFAGALLWGRIYCGWMCPQTTLSELVATLERWVCPRRGPRTTRCKVLSVAASLFIAGFVAWSLVSYFLDRSEWFWPGPGVWITWALTAGVLAADFLWLRHRFCVGVCPYGLLQNIIQDNRTLGVELDPARKAECTNCLLCVRACFMGVDIRTQAFDPRCLNCGDCIAATRLAKTCPEEPLISFRYGTDRRSTWPAWLRKAGVLDARRAVVALLFAASCGLVVAQAAGRQDLDAQVTALFDRTRTDEAGVVHNTYRLALGNRLERPVKLELAVEGVPGLVVEASGAALELGARERLEREVILKAPAAQAGGGVHSIVVKLRAAGPPGQADRPVAELPVKFFVPEKR